MIINLFFFKKFEFTRVNSIYIYILFEYILGLKDVNETVYYINALSLLNNIIILFTLVGFYKTSFIFYFIEIFYMENKVIFSLFLGKFLSLYKTSFLMEVTEIISIAPLLVQMIRCLIQTINKLIIFKA